MLTDKQYQAKRSALYSRLDRAERALRKAQDEIVDLLAIAAHPRNKSRLDGAYDDIERARRKLSEVTMR